MQRLQAKVEECIALAAGQRVRGSRVSEGVGRVEDPARSVTLANSP